MHEINFLPQRYREHATRRIVIAWRTVVVALAVALAGAAFYTQRGEFARLDADVREVRHQHDMVKQREAIWLALNEEIRELDAAAEWHTYVRRPWPRSQILATVVRDAPAAVQFRDLRVAREAPAAITAPAPAAVPINRALEALQAKSLRPLERDLKRLREATDPRPTVVTLLGTTSDLAALHIFLADLTKNDLLTRCELRSIEAGAEPGQSRFQVRLLVRPELGASDIGLVAERSGAVTGVRP